MSVILSVSGENSESTENLTLTITDCVFCGQGGTVITLDSNQAELLKASKGTLEDLLPSTLDDFTKELLGSSSHEYCWINAW